MVDFVAKKNNEKLDTKMTFCQFCGGKQADFVLTKITIVSQTLDRWQHGGSQD